MVLNWDIPGVHTRVGIPSNWHIRVIGVAHVVYVAFMIKEARFLTLLDVPIFTINITDDVPPFIGSRRHMGV